MHVAHPGQDRLLGDRVHPPAQRRILTTEAAQRGRQFGLVRLSSWLNGHFIDGRRIGSQFQGHRVPPVTQGIARIGIPQLDDRANVTGLQALNGDRLFATHDVELPQSLLFVLVSVVGPGV